LPELRICATSGEALPARLLVKFREAFPTARLLNIYGSSEVSADVSCFDTSGQDAEAGRVSIGRPIANTQIYILDSSFWPTGIAAPGELYVGGANLARGYLSRPELTAERFVPNPFSRVGGERLFKTGDLGRFSPDGNIEYLGRTDNQVKIRGYRIELGEIERALCAHPAVRESVVVVREDAEGQRRLVGYVVIREGRGIEVAELRAHLKHRLPDYMVPAALVVLDEVPLKVSGKIDVEALPAPDPAQQLQASYVAPRTPVEQMLAEVFAQVLEVNQVGIFDNFFDLGGHSLLATLLTSRIREAFNVELPVITIFEAPTVLALSVAVAQKLIERAYQEDGSGVDQFLDEIARPA
jgi:acyl-coenzyme A synthetase/AMP-(fatty) acid ligase